MKKTFLSQKGPKAIGPYSTAVVTENTVYMSGMLGIDPAIGKLADNREDVLIVKINIDEEPELARQERIEVIPTLVVYKDGYEMGSIVAPESRARIEEFLSEVL